MTSILPEATASMSSDQPPLTQSQSQPVHPATASRHSPPQPLLSPWRPVMLQAFSCQPERILSAAAASGDAKSAERPMETMAQASRGGPRASRRAYRSHGARKPSDTGGSGLAMSAIA